MSAKITIEPDLIARCRFLYEETLTPSHEIYALMDVSRSTFYARVSEWKWKRRRYSATVAADTIVVPAPSQQVLPSDENAEPAPVTSKLLATIYARAIRAVGWELDKIEGVLRTLRPEQEAQSERASRIVSTVNRTLCEIAALTKAEEAKPQDDADADPIPSDIDEFRRELARRIRGLVDAERNRESESSGTGAAD